MGNTYFTDNILLNHAIHFATDRHAGQLRKGTTLPYIIHPLETMTILASMNADTNLLIAGLLHDTLEDTDTTDEELLVQFGEDVYTLVKGHSEDKSQSWEERKLRAINELQKGTLRLKMLVMADKTANLRSMYFDHKLVGDKLWERFNAPKEKQAWYYSRIQAALQELKDHPGAAHVYREMSTLYEQLFEV